MSDLKLFTLSEILLNAPKCERGYIYLQGEYPWTLYSNGLIHTWDGKERTLLETVNPDFYLENNLYPVMSVYDAQDVIFNAQMQKRGLLMTELLACFNHYSQYWGFLQLSKTE